MRALAAAPPTRFTPEQVAALLAASELRPLEPAQRIGAKDLHDPGASLTTTLRVPANGIRFLRWRALR